MPRHCSSYPIANYDGESTLKVLYPWSVIVGRSLQSMYPTSLGMNSRFGLSDQNEECSQEVTGPNRCPETFAE